MSTDSEMEDVKRELRKLKGETICTKPQRKANHIIDVDDKGFLVKARTTAYVERPKVLKAYGQLKRSGELDNRGADRPFSYRGAFVMPLLAELSTVEWVSCRPRTLRYIAEGLPVHLKSLQ